MYTAVLNFWFREIEPRQWWAVDPEFDARIRGSIPSPAGTGGQW